MPVGGWITYYIVKGVLTILIGCFVTPYVISRYIIRNISKTK